jgi:hypothetical protein
MSDFTRLCALNVEHSMIQRELYGRNQTEQACPVLPFINLDGFKFSMQHYLLERAIAPRGMYESL